jgi:SAM-dependent methyltransferase
LSTPRIFDAQHYESLNISRGAAVSMLLSEMIQPLGLQTALDVGCGLGHFSGLMDSCGLRVSAVDGRQGNVDEAERRFPRVSFRQFDAEDSAIRQLGKFDLVFCFGLLYHLENPMLTIRHLREMTEKMLLIESVIYPGKEPIMALVDEGRTEDQGLNHLAFYPTEACLVKMLYRAGFSSVYGFKTQPDHPEYYEGTNTRRTRTILAGTIQPAESRLLHRISETSTPVAPWDPTSGLPKRGIFQKIRSFMDRNRRS